jgi:hypothetical protein
MGDFGGDESTAVGKDSALRPLRPEGEEPLLPLWANQDLEDAGALPFEVE